MLQRGLTLGMGLVLFAFVPGPVQADAVLEARWVYTQDSRDIMTIRANGTFRIEGHDWRTGHSVVEGRWTADTSVTPHRLRTVVTRTSFERDLPAAPAVGDVFLGIYRLLSDTRLLIQINDDTEDPYPSNFDSDHAGIWRKS